MSHEDLIVTPLATYQIDQLHADTQMLALIRQTETETGIHKPAVRRRRWFAPHVPAFVRRSPAH